MKNWRLKFLVVSVACVLAVVAVKYLPALLCGGGESEVYHRYEHRDDLKVGFVKDYRIDDSTTVDVTTLTAKDSAGWEALQREMNRSEEAIERSRNRIKEGHYVLTDYYCEIGQPEHRIPFKEGECWLVYVNHKEKTFYIFHIINHEQGYLIIRSKTRELYNNRKK